MISFSTGNPEEDQKIQARIQARITISLLSFETPTPENIQRFKVFCEMIINDAKNPDSDNFKNALSIFTQIYENKKKTNRSPIWQLLSADAIFSMYMNTLPESGLPLSHPHIKQCLMWAKAIINFPTINHPSLDTEYKIDACEWIAGIYERRGRSEAEKKKITPDSKNSLIQLSFKYYEKMLDIINASQKATYNDISFILLEIAEIREKYLPNDLTLEDNDTKRLIQAMEQVIEFHSNVPDDKKSKTKLIGIRHARLESDQITGQKNEDELKIEKEQLDKDEPPIEMWKPEERRDADRKSTIAMGRLGKLYSTIPKSPGEEPDYQKAVIWLDQANTSLYANEADIGELLEKPEIQKAQEEVRKKVTERIEITYAGLIDLTNSYLNKSDMDSSKRDIFETLKKTLENPEEESKHERVLAFEDKLDTINKTMLFTHRTDTWKRYLYNVSIV